MSSMQSNESSDEQSAAAANMPMIQHRSSERKPQQQCVLKGNFQFYQTWSPNSLDDYEYGNVDDTGNNNVSCPIVVAPPNYGPLQRPPPLTSRQKRYNNRNPEKTKTNNDAADAVTNFMTALDNNNNNGDGVTVSAPPVLNTPQRLKKSLNSLLTTPTSDPLFDDDDEGQKISINDEEITNDNYYVQPLEFYHSDDAITSWIWKPEQIDSSKRAESNFGCVLEKGRAVHATEPLLGVVSTIEGGDSSKPWPMNTNLNLMHKAIDITVKRNNNLNPLVDGSNTGEESSPADSYKLYQARHPSLAPLIYVENLINDAKDAQSILSIFDITPNHHQSLRELLRTDEFLSKPLFPNVEGHEVECIEKNRIHHQLRRRKPLSWLNPGDNASDESLCRCHKIFDTDDDWGIQENMQTIAQTPSLSKGSESEQVVSSPPRTATTTQQFNFGDLRKWPLRERRLKRYQVGTAYRADVADLRIRFLALQLFHAVDFCHVRGISLGDQLSPDRIFVQDDGWIRIVPPITWKEMKEESQTNENGAAAFQQNPQMLNGSPRKDWRTIFHRQHGRSTDANHASDEGCKIIPYIGYGDTPTLQWQKGLLTNLAYLMILNAASGRTVGSQNNPPMLPWVTNFAGEIDLRADMGNMLLEKSPYWRDLSKSKFRLTKGDDQLDHTYQNLRHHVPETLSEITYTVYKARVLPIHQLRSTIRDEFIAEHYPDSMQKIYEWSPDEATIEFYVQTEPCPFKSMHNEMNDLSLPKWCASIADFISYHRNLLESDYVSKHLHLWIDLNFGEALSGARAVSEKNVPLYCSRKSADHYLCHGDCHSVLSGATGEKEVRVETSSLKSLFVQLFSHRHPKKHSILRNAISTKIRTAVIRGNEKGDGRDEGRKIGYDWTARKKRDISMIGVLLNDCYNAARVIPSPDVQSAITSLLCGSLDLHHSLNEDKVLPGAIATLFSFPKHLRDEYAIVSKAQHLTFRRLPSGVVSDDNMYCRSTDLEQAWTLIRNASAGCIDKLPISGVGLILPTLLHPLSGKHIEENCISSRPFSAFAENLCNYLVALSNKVPGEVLLPRLLKLLQASSDRVDTTEQLSKICLSRPLIANMYSSSGGEYFISKICRFLLKQLCNQDDEPNAAILDRSTVGVFFTSLLAQDDVVGPSICCHYVIPLLMDNLELCSNRSCGNMIVKSLKSLLPFLPEDAIGVLICKKILRKVIPKVLSRRGPTSVDNLQDAIFLTELVVLLQHCLRLLDSGNIVKYFFRTNSGSVSDVLASSMAWTLCSTKSGANDVRICYEMLLKEACVLVCNAFRRIDSYQLHDTLLPLFESFCYLVNDSHLTDVLNESVLPRDGESRNEIFNLPGVKETNAMLHEALGVCEEETLKTSCPSVAEFLAFLNPPEEETHKIDGIPAIDNQKQGFCDENEYNSKSDGVVSLYNSISLSNNNKLREVSDGSSIEMLSSKELNVFNESVVKDSGKAKKKNRLVTNNSSFLQNPTDDQVTRNVKDKLDLVWLLGLHKQDKKERIKYSWRPRLMLSAKLDIKKSLTSDNTARILCMETNKSESLLASGTSDGELLLFDLKRHPPALRARHRFHCVEENNEPARPIEQVGFLDAEDRLLICDGGLHLFDVEAQSTVTSLSSKNTFFSDQGAKPWGYEDLVAFSSFPKGTGSAEILDGSVGNISAISSAYLYGIDMRCSKGITSRNSVVHKLSQPDALFKSLTWHTGIVATKEFYEKSNSSQEQDSSFNFTCLTSHCGGGDWICVGSSSGHIHLFDRRRGKLLACWRAHQKAVVYIKSISRYKVLSASADKTAVLWNIMSSPPQKISSIYNIPGKEHSINVASHHFREDGLVSVPDGDLILCAVTGRKTVFMPMPTTQLQPDGSPLEVKAERVVMSDCEGNPIPSSEKLKVSSVALLPCRQLVLLGCEGEIHVCL